MPNMNAGHTPLNEKQIVFKCWTTNKIDCKQKAAISPVLAMGFEKFSYDQMYNYLEKLKMIGGTV